jgi:hypothetical protein
MKKLKVKFLEDVKTIDELTKTTVRYKKGDETFLNVSEAAQLGQRQLIRLDEVLSDQEMNELLRSAFYYGAPVEG